MIEPSQYVWYLSYGSNLSFERFLCYIKGGRPTGATRILKGCSDQTIPLDIQEIFICYPLYFAKKSRNWQNGGVAFISNKLSDKCDTLAKIYQISKEQFIEIFKQETNFDADVNIDFEAAKKTGNFVINENSWYGKIIYFGEQEGLSIYSFTNANDIQELNKPSDEYLSTIIKGIKETFIGIENVEIVEYLLKSGGIGRSYEELLFLIQQCE
ncbi:MAG: hypothetical protein K9H61_04390 [Bacteroidia bacterium]|nr:hypothetical protein [Bacteroidia bacterium]MCF8427302.1 hypothetical protein [Bacteroidia bacterium]MCF8446215.1 hypothetical protein [Bacteroidia bacterium]